MDMDAMRGRRFRPGSAQRRKGVDLRFLLSPLMAAVLLMLPAGSHARAEGRATPALWQTLMARPAVTIGPAHPRTIIQVLFDPNCPYCHRLWLRLQPYARRGLAVRWIPVAFIRPSSLPKAAAILAARDPVQAFTFNEAHYDTARMEGGQLPLYAIPQALRAQIEANTALFERLQTPTPAIVYQAQNGRVAIIRGWDIGKVNAWLASLGAEH